MIIEVKDLPEGQKIDKIDIHIDFQKGTANVSTSPTYTPQIPQPNSTTKVTGTQESPSVPKEMFDVEF